jgi:hypothetical protein
MPEEPKKATEVKEENFPSQENEFLMEETEYSKLREEIV